MIWREKRSRISAVQMDNLRGLVGIRRVDKMPNAFIRELYGVKKGVDDGITKRVYLGECMDSRLVGRLRKR